MLAGAGGLAFGAVGSAGPARAQNDTTVGTDGGTTTGEGTPAGTTQTPGPEDEAQIQTRAIIPEVGEPFQGNYVGQFVIFTDPTPRQDATPEVVAECDFANWPPERTRTAQVLLLDRISRDDPQGVTVEAFLNEDNPDFSAGNTFIVNRIEDCTGQYLGLVLEDVPEKNFQPAEEPGNPPLVAESPGPTLSPTQDGGGDGDSIAPGQPGFGAIAAGVGLGAAALLRKLLSRS